MDPTADHEPVAAQAEPSLRDHLHDVRPGDRWLAVVAHPDDESFGCGSLLARAASLGATVTVLCATRGEAGEPARPLPPGLTLGEVRERELHAAAEVLGVDEVLLLDHADSGFDGDLPAGALCAADPEVVVVQVARVLERVRPHVVVVLDGSDGHRDHVVVRARTIEALRRHPATVALVETCLPNSLMRRWLDEMRATRPDTAYHSIDPSVIGRDDAAITDVIDVRGVRDRRDAAIAAHASQASPFDDLTEDLRSAFLDVEHLARVEPAAAGA